MLLACIMGLLLHGVAMALDACPPTTRLDTQLPTVRVCAYGRMRRCVSQSPSQPFTADLAQAGQQRDLHLSETEGGQHRLVQFDLDGGMVQMEWVGASGQVHPPTPA